MGTPEDALPDASPPEQVLPPEYVLPLVVRVERAAPPARTDALEAAARAVLLMVATEVPGWRTAVEAWAGNRIRKVVRRARGAEWRRAQTLDGVTITHRSAEVRVHPPVPLDAWPRDLARLQVSGTDLDDPTASPDPAPHTPVVLLSPTVTMSTGKAMAQAGHAAQLGLYTLGPAAALAWQANGFTLAVRTATPAEWDSAVTGGAPVVHDAGFTEVEPGSATATIRFPGRSGPISSSGRIVRRPSGTAAGGHRRA